MGAEAASDSVTASKRQQQQSLPSSTGPSSSSIPFNGPHPPLPLGGCGGGAGVMVTNTTTIIASDLP
jgi:hypothetical protein